MTPPAALRMILIAAAACMCSSATNAETCPAQADCDSYFNQCTSKRLAAFRHLSNLYDTSEERIEIQVREAGVLFQSDLLLYQGVRLTMCTLEKSFENHAEFTWNEALDVDEDTPQFQEILKRYHAEPDHKKVFEESVACTEPEIYKQCVEAID